jgi:predicted acylesterase/phospholipase RssA
MWRIAAATAAAPIFFRPVRIESTGWFVDGGLWANTPITVGVAEGIKLGYSLDEIRVLSVGTGQQSFHYEGAPHPVLGRFRHGLLGWRQSLVSLTMHAQSQRANNLTSYFLPSGQLMRIDFPLPSDAGGLDAVHQASMFAERARAHAKVVSREVRRQFFSEEALPFTPVPIPKGGVISTLQPSN